jgi:hypothetical protein
MVSKSHLMFNFLFFYFLCKQFFKNTSVDKVEVLPDLCEGFEVYLLKKWRTSLIIPNLLSFFFLKKCTQTLKNVNLRYPSFNFFQFQPSIRIFS